MSTLAIADLCRKFNKNCVILVGGYRADALPGDFMYPDAPFDYIFTGEGEIALYFREIRDCVHRLSEENLVKCPKG